MNLLPELGLGVLCDDEDFFENVLVPYVLENGEVFHGYYGLYVWQRLGYLELNFHCKPEGDKYEICGFTSNVSGNNMWRLAVSTHGRTEADLSDDANEDKDYLSRIIYFTHPETHEGNVAVNLVNADVVPDFYPDDQYTMQVICIANEVTYYRDFNEYHNDPICTVMGKPVLFAENNVTSLLTESVAVGTVKNINQRYSFDGDNNIIKFYAVEIQTNFGVLEILHGDECIKDGQKELIQPGSIIKAIGTVFGDVAIGKYQKGAIFDEEHLTRLLRGCIEAFDFTRISRLLSDDCKYISATGAIKAEGGQEVYKFLTGVANSRKKDNLPIYVYPGELIGYDNTNEYKTENMEHEIGSHCIAVAHNDEGQPDTFLFIKLDADKKICEIKSCGEKYEYYQLRIDYPKNDEEPFNPDNVIKTAFNEGEWLEKLANCYMKGNFDDTSFYYGLAVDCTVGTPLGNGAGPEFYVNNRETMYNYLTEPISHEDHEIVAEIIDGNQWGHDRAVKVTIDGETHVCVLDINDEGHLQTLYEYPFDNLHDFTNAQVDEENFLLKIGTAYEKYIVGDIIKDLEPDFHYGSFWVFQDITSAKAYLEYLRGKVSTLKKNGIKTVANILKIKGSGKPCLLIHSGTGKDAQEACLIVTKLDKGLISRMDMMPKDLYQFEN